MERQNEKLRAKKRKEVHSDADAHALSRFLFKCLGHPAVCSHLSTPACSHRTAPVCSHPSVETTLPSSVHPSLPLSVHIAPLLSVHAHSGKGAHRQVGGAGVQPRPASQGELFVFLTHQASCMSSSKYCLHGSPSNVSMALK